MKRSKLLSVSVAAYNGQETLEKALSSCLVHQMDALEVIVVDDGSTDATLSIAQKFSERYPHVFKVIHQSNRGYGSTIEVALSQASGCYFRTLDCDDWFDTEALDALLCFLGTCEADIVFTNYRTVNPGGSGQTHDVCHGRESTGAILFDNLPPGDALDMEIHAVTFRTDMLHSAQMALPHHCHYTDLLYSFIGVAAAKTLCFFSVFLYNYRLGRDGQSVSLESYQAHFEDYRCVTEAILQRTRSLPADAHGAILLSRARDIAQYGIELLLRFPISKKTKSLLLQYDKFLRMHFPAVANMMHNKNTRLLRCSHYFAYCPLCIWEKKKRS